MAQILLAEGAAPATPAANTSTLYVKADGKAYLKDDAGTEYPLSAPATTTDLTEGTNLYFTEARVRATVATGLSDTAGTPAAADSILTILGKIKKAFFTDHTGAGGAVHANVVAAGAAGFMTGSDKTKIDLLSLANTLTTSGNFASTFTMTGTTGVTFPVSGTLATLAGTETISNKRAVPRRGSTTSSATPTINTDNTDVYSLTAQAANITSFTTNLSGTPNHGDGLLIEITGTAARTIAWGASFESSTVALPVTTVTTAMLTVMLVWNSTTSKWRCIGAC